VAAGPLKKPFWTHIVGQLDVRTHLAESLRSDHAAHATLFSGARGIGKTAAALEFAALLLCDRNELTPCGECPQCVASARLQHPDLHLVYPLPPVKTRRRALDDGDSADSKGESVEEDPAQSLGDRIALMNAALAEDPYVPIVLPKVRGQKEKEEQKSKVETLTIKIPQIRSLLRVAAMKPYQARRKVFVIVQADSMNEAAQNALLKALEEPGPEAYFLLTTESERNLLPTIRSRCQCVRMAPLAREDIMTALTREGITAERAETAAALSGGSFSHARELSGSDLEAMQKRVIEYLRAAAMCDAIKLPEVSEKLLETGRLPESTALEMLGMFLRDVAIRRVDGGPSAFPITFRAFEEPIKSLLASYPEANLDEAAGAVDQSAGYLARGYTQTFVLYSLAINLNEALGTRVIMKSKSAQTRHA
jgi:DNA polymerase-3 subunit delta'